MHTGEGSHRLRLAFFALPLMLALAGCETLDAFNPFEEKKTPLQGERRAVFPSGVPGVEFNAPPPQPANSNIPITPGMSLGDNPERAAAAPNSESQPAAQRPARQAAARDASKQAQKSRSKSASKSEEEEDPWAGQR